jgi:hypothetical protein
VVDEKEEELQAAKRKEAWWSHGAGQATPLRLLDS